MTDAGAAEGPWTRDYQSGFTVSSPRKRRRGAGRARRMGIVAVAVGVFLYGLLWIPQGLDLSDDGFHLTEQRALIAAGLQPRPGPSGPFWGSDVFGGLWQGMVPDGLLFARLGWALWIAATAASAFMLLSRLFAPRDVALAIGLSMPLLLGRGRMLIDYNVVPAFWLVLALGGWIGRPRHRRWTALGAGVALAVAGLARIPTLVAVTLPLLSLGWRRLVRAAHRPALAGPDLGRIAFGFTAVPVAAAAVLAAAGSGSALPALLDTNHAHHELATVLARAAIDLRLTACVALAVAAAQFACAGAARAKAARATAAIGAAVALGVATRVPTESLYTAIEFTAVGAAIGILPERLLALREGRIGRVWISRLEIVVVGLAAALAACLGSSGGAVEAGVWPLAPASGRVPVRARNGSTREPQDPTPRCSRSLGSRGCGCPVGVLSAARLAVSRCL